MSLDDLHAAVCERPADDAPRTAYADFIAPYRPERAEIVRIQLDRYAQERVHRVKRNSMSGRERLLLTQHEEEWSRYMRMFLVPATSISIDHGCTHERGFIGHARIAVHNVMGLGERLYEMAPIQHLDVTPGGGAAIRVLSAPKLDQLDSISLSGLGLGDDDAIALSSCTALERAAWVDLRNNHIGRAGVEALARSPLFKTKVRVLLEGNPCDPVEAADFD
jgi:uncharacterized protein (TIGR02996 family)